MAEEDTELEEFFGDESETEEEVETEVEDESKVEEGSEEAEEEESESESEDTDETETTSEKDDKVSNLVPKAALIDERRKRQALEERLAKLEEVLPPQEEELPDPYEDREGYEKALRDKWERERIQKAEQDRLKKIEERRGKMLEDHEDFAEKERIFEILSVKDKDLRNEMLDSNDPVGFAYEKATEYYNEVMKPEKVLTTEMPDESEIDEPKADAKKKPNLATATAGKSNKVEVENDDTLEDVFADQDY